MTDLQAKLERESGLCTSIAHDDAENLRRIRFILSAYEQFLPLEYSLRAFNDWLPVESLPMDFEQYCYRLSRA